MIVNLTRIVCRYQSISARFLFKEFYGLCRAMVWPRYQAGYTSAVRFGPCWPGKHQAEATCGSPATNSLRTPHIFIGP
jgi:hypothetical protein